MTTSTAVPVRLRRWLRTFVPHPSRPRRADLARGALGGFLGILVAALVGRAVPGGSETLPFIVAPIGASAVLLLAVPASPLAQPWSLLGGNTISAAIGIAAAKLIDDPVLAPAAAVGAAIGVMMLTGCLHPPGGACALFAAAGGPAVQEHGFAFALWPVGMNSLCLLAVAIAVNNLTGRRYPHAPTVPGAAAPAAVEPSPMERTGLRTTDIERAIQRLDAGLDIMAADVVALVRDAEAQALDRRLGQLRCRELMTTDVAVVEPDETLFRARLLMNARRVKALPVVDHDRHVVGIVTVDDLFNLDVAELAPVSSVMTAEVVTMRDAAPVADLVAVMTDAGVHHVPILDATGRLVGLVTRAELVAVLHRALVDGP